MFFFFIIIPPFPVVVGSATSTAGCGYNVRLHNQFYNRFSDIWGRGKSGSSRNSVGIWEQRAIIGGHCPSYRMDISLHWGFTKRVFIFQVS